MNLKWKRFEKERSSRRQGFMRLLGNRLECWTCRLRIGYTTICNTQRPKVKLLLSAVPKIASWKSVNVKSACSGTWHEMGFSFPLHKEGFSCCWISRLSPQANVCFHIELVMSLSRRSPLETRYCGPVSCYTFHPEVKAQPIGVNWRRSWFISTEKVSFI